jgi:hypothetical protein
MLLWTLESGVWRCSRQIWQPLKEPPVSVLRVRFNLKDFAERLNFETPGSCLYTPFRASQILLLKEGLELGLDLDNIISRFV